MLFSESIKTALDSIKSNATRSFLTALAIIIGIASVIAMLSIGASAQKALEDEKKELETAKTEDQPKPTKKSCSCC